MSSRNFTGDVQRILTIAFVAYFDSGLNMEVRINLSPEAYEFLMGQIPEGLTTHRALENARLIRSHVDRLPLEYEIECDDDVAQSLLRFASRHCPAAVPEIDFALRAARSKERQPPRRGLFRR